MLGTARALAIFGGANARAAVGTVAFLGAAAFASPHEVPNCGSDNDRARNGTGNNERLVIAL